MEIKCCPSCISREIKKFEFGQYWCTHCRKWFSKEKYKGMLKLNVKKKNEIY